MSTVNKSSKKMKFLNHNTTINYEPININDSRCIFIKNLDFYLYFHKDPLIICNVKH